MAGELKRDTVVILRMDGEELEEFVKSPSFEAEMIDIFSRKELPNATLREFIGTVLEQLTIDHGMPPSSDSWVTDNFIEPVLSCVSTDILEIPASQEIFLVEVKKIVESIVHCLKEHPVIVARSEYIIDGIGIRTLLSNASELDKSLETAWRDLQKGQNQRAYDESLHNVLSVISPLSGLPPHGISDQVVAVINKSFGIVNAEYEKALSEVEFKKLVYEIVESIMLQLEENPITVCSNSVVHEHFASSSSPLAFNI